MRNDTPRTFVGTTTFTVSGISGDRGERDVITEIDSVEGVETVTIDRASGVVTVTASGPVDRADITSAVAKAGYTLTG